MSKSKRVAAKRVKKVVGVGDQIRIRRKRTNGTAVTTVAGGTLKAELHESL